LKAIQDQYAVLVLQRESENIILANKLVKDKVVQKEEIEQALKRKPSVKPQQQSSTTETEGPNPNNNSNDVAAEIQTTQADASAGTRAQDRKSRLEQRNQIDQQVANAGILAILSTNSANAAEGTVQDIIGANSEASKDYDRVFNSIDQMVSKGDIGRNQDGSGKGTGQGTNRTAIKGERTTKGGRIKTSISGIAPSGAGDMSRSSGFIAAEITPISSGGNEIDMKVLNIGARNVNQVKAVVQAHTQAIEYCYQRERKRQPDLKGKISVRFTILPSGKVKDPKILSSTIKNSNIERCILSRISRWDDFGDIAPSEGNASFRQIYSFGF
jgi:outer membrane biosynthesis protein TonB